MWRGEARAGERGAATRGGERGEGGARGSSICVLPAMPRTSEALPPVYRRAELELNFPSSAEARGDGTEDAHLTAGPSPSSPSARTDLSQRADEPEPEEVAELEMNLLGGAGSGAPAALATTSNGSRLGGGLGTAVVRAGRTVGSVT